MTQLAFNFDFEAPIPVDVSVSVCSDEKVIADTEDKTWWIGWGNQKEQDFLKLCAREAILPGIKKSSGSKFRPEYTYQGGYLDLKTVETPFFLAQKHYGVDSNFAVSLNKPDVLDCTYKYPKCQLVFWVQWVSEIKYGVAVETRHEIRFLSYERMRELVSHAPEHIYQKRIDDNKGNAKESYILDLRDMEFIWQGEVER